jgi:hypothetical protein
MTDFLIDTPYHKRWRLPDGIHLYNSVLHGDCFRISILHALSGEIKDSHTIKIADGWEDLCVLSQELANKKYRRIPCLKSQKVRLYQSMHPLAS